MKNVSDKQVVAYLLQQMAMMILAESPVKDSLQKHADKHRGKLFAELTKEEIEPITIMRDAVLELTKKLVRCEDVNALNMTYDYLKALNDGEVLLAVEDGSGVVTGYENNV